MRLCSVERRNRRQESSLAAGMRLSIAMIKRDKAAWEKLRAETWFYVHSSSKVETKRTSFR